MRAYTDLEQSKKLTEILPVNSADMKFPYFGDGQYGTTAVFGEPIEFSGGKDIPCWSLAALIQIMPHCIYDRYDLVLGQLSDNKGWYVCYDDIDHFVEPYATNSNLIDACVDMILILKENDLI